MWEGWRNPVIYKKTEELNLDFDNLDFKKVPPGDEEYILSHMEMENKHLSDFDKSIKLDNSIELDSISDLKLSIEDAKIGLSNKYDIPVENIEIIMKG